MYEDLSRLLDGELSEEEANALHNRMKADPELSAAWEAMCGLPDAIADLPDIAPPAHLDAQILDRTAPKTTRQISTWQMASVVALAAALSLAVLWTATRSPVVQRSETTLFHGELLVSGPTTVQASAATIEVNGRARISVEPEEGVVRVPVQEDEMNRSHVLAAAIGGVVTLTVYEGTAMLWSAGEASPVEVAAGQTRTVRVPATRSGTHSTQEATAKQVAVPLELSADMPPEEQIAKLKQALQQTQFEAKLAKGQLALYQGEPTAWPDQHPTALGPEGFESTMQEAIAKVGGLDLVDVDCNEFPCIAYVRPQDPSAPWDTYVTSAGESLSSHYEQGAGVMAMGFERKTDQGEDSLMAMSVIPADHMDDVVQNRTGMRARDFAEGEQPPEDTTGETEDVDISR